VVAGSIPAAPTMLNQLLRKLRRQERGLHAVTIRFSFTGKPLKDGFCHVVTYLDHVNLGFNRGALLPDPDGVLQGTGKLIRHVTMRDQTELDRPFVRRYLQAAIEQVGGPPSAGAAPHKR
jgi:hypothetical protein